MKTLFDSVQSLAREAAAEEETLPADAVPTLSRSDHERIVQSILRGRSQRAGRPTSRPHAFFYVASFAVAMATMLALWVRPSSRDHDDDRSFPAYTVTASGGAKDVRGGETVSGAADTATASPQVVRGDSELVVNLRPAAAVSGPIGARAFIVASAGMNELVVSSRAAPSGAIQMVFRGADLQGQRSGQAVLNVVVGRPDAISSLDSRAVGRDRSGPGWRVVSVPLVFGANGN
jgi:hypothetical protein